MTDRAEYDPTDHNRYDDWDAAYVLGALSTAERHEYENHLSQCQQCAAAVAALAGVPGLLGALPAADAFAMLDADAPASGAAAVLDGASEPPANMLPRLTARVRQRRRARAWTVGIVGVAAAAALTAAIVLPASLNPPAQPTLSATLAPVTPSPVAATVQLTSVRWGTKIAVNCTYGISTAAPSYTAETGRYGLYVTTSDGTTAQVSTWRAWPGATVNTTASTETRESDIVRIELRSLDTGAVLLRRSLS